MTPAKLNLTVTRGITFRVALTCKSSAGAVVDLTGWSVQAQARPSIGGSPVITLPFVVEDAEAGLVSMDYTDEQTRALTVVKFKWDLVFINPDGERLGPYVEGVYVVKDIITQPT